MEILGHIIENLGDVMFSSLKSTIISVVLIGIIVALFIIF